MKDVIMKPRIISLLYFIFLILKYDSNIYYLF